MAEFAASARGFAVQVQVRVAYRENLAGVGDIHDQVQHGGGANRARRA
jgi:hypothetical protein